ncbi:ribonuclease H-like domain-containing protein [Coralloluteibacterium stylophorae]|uniref:Ribonuclease H-like domain-containing protein n=1 Tax=Coralloluteibacterium stylophorae TaxID=1776034 RepID=A0A8J7VT84_9GAMM|nr:ribonuclease H-like domain-containing protein [Coralloluteibacterium stylophorae]MBS7457412.1 ribonuclease H-like domain-containing protein [Coralloluteibacterium stylophorae]
MSGLARRLRALRQQAGGATLGAGAATVPSARPLPAAGVEPRAPRAGGGPDVDAVPRDGRALDELAPGPTGARLLAAPTQAPTPARRPPVPEELRRLLGVRNRTGMPAPRSRAAPDRRVDGEEIAPGLRYLEQRFAWARIPHAIDCCRVRGTPRPPPLGANSAPHPVGAVAGARFLAFDTETTGLAGGTGTRAFMIGAADWHEGALRLRQLTITTLGAEAAMLRTFATWLRADTVLVSYNGRSYDAPLLATRYRLARLANPLAGLAHLDLLHPVRRRWRGIWPNCRLATAERELLGVLREDDLPGAEAPRAWLDYLRGGDARDLRRVGAHNAQDLRSLGGLLERLGAEAG